MSCNARWSFAKASGSRRMISTSPRFLCGWRRALANLSLRPRQRLGRRHRPRCMMSPARRSWIASARCRSEEHTSELQSLMRISYAVFCLKKKKKTIDKYNNDARKQPRQETKANDKQPQLTRRITSNEHDQKHTP